MQSTTRIDSHQHFWKYNPVRDGWITEDMKIIQRDFYPDELAPILKENNFDGCVAVQADQSEEETNFLLELAQQHSFIKGVVGWVDLHSELVEERLFYFRQHTKLKGIRHIVQVEPSGFMTQKEFLNGIKTLKKFNLTYDILVKEHQLEETLWFVNQFPDQKFVIDHIAKPNIGKKDRAFWTRNMAAIATFPNVFCKLSGLVTEADWKNWKPTDFEPYLNTIFTCYGMNRVMYGSDWPVCLVAGSYKQQLGIIEQYITSFSASEKQLVMGENAARFYNL
ncbi:MAG: amidohydrolase family protein [Cyclobacteriaceae bacterium]|nr:amidohydrolase family protein [Cyclobacteriaceae bacterium]